MATSIFDWGPWTLNNSSGGDSGMSLGGLGGIAGGLLGLLGGGDEPAGQTTTTQAPWGPQ